jgi:hypothetical protein
MLTIKKKMLDDENNTFDMTIKDYENNFLRN